jgi:hypothetical protein
MRCAEVRKEMYSVFEGITYSREVLSFSVKFLRGHFSSFFGGLLCGMSRHADYIAPSLSRITFLRG